MTDRPDTPPEPRVPASARTGAPRSRLALLAALGLLLLLVAVGLTWTLARTGDADPVAQAPEAGAETGGEAGLAAYDLDGDGIVFQSGMHPWVVQDEPGQCPICGMDLQPVPTAGAASPEGVVEIDPVTLQNTGVRTAAVAVEALSRSLRTTGRFEASERARTDVTLRASGWIERLYASAEGDRVRRGQPLLEVYSPELVAAQEEFLLALRTRRMMGEQGERVVQAARRRLDLLELTDEQIARLESGGDVQRTLTVYSPASGTVTSLSAVEGMQARAGQQLMRITDLSGLWLQVDVPERDLAWVDEGTRAVVTLDGQPGSELSARVGYVYDLLDPATRTATARIDVPNPAGRLKPGMFAVATLYGRPSDALPVVPSEAILRTGEQAIVLLALGEGRFRPQPVTLGEEAQGRVQVLAGLDGGERVVTSAQFLIDSEARLAASLDAMGAPGEPAPAVDPSTTNR